MLSGISFKTEAIQDVDRKASGGRIDDEFQYQLAAKVSQHDEDKCSQGPADGDASTPAEFESTKQQYRKDEPTDYG